MTRPALLWLASRGLSFLLLLDLHSGCEERAAAFAVPRGTYGDGGGPCANNLLI